MITSGANGCISIFVVKAYPHAKLASHSPFLSNALIYHRTIKMKRACAHIFSYARLNVCPNIKILGTPEVEAQTQHIASFALRTIMLARRNPMALSSMNNDSPCGV